MSASQKDLDSEVGKRLAEIRQERGLDQGEVAQKINLRKGAKAITAKSISGYENGNHIPDQRVAELCLVLETEPRFLLMGRGERHMAPDHIRETLKPYGNIKQLRESIWDSELSRLESEIAILQKTKHGRYI